MSGRRAGRGAARLAAALAALVVLAGLGAPPAAAAERLDVVGVDTSAYPDVVVTAGVPSALLGADLPPEAVVVEEDGEPRTARVERVATGALDVVMVVDTSGSMNGEPMAAARAAASSFLDRLPARARVAVVGFGPTPVVASPFTSDRPALHAAVAALESRGETALHDALRTAAGLFDPASQARRVMVLLSDGGDTVSTATFEEAVAAVNGVDARLDVVALTSAEFDGAALDGLAAAAGGRVAPATSPEALLPVYEEIAASLTAEYRITFRSERQRAATLRVALDHGGVAAEAALPVVLPVVPTAPPAPPQPPEPPEPTVVVGDAPLLGTDWALPAGAGALFLALAATLALAFAPRRGSDRRLRSVGGAAQGRATGSGAAGLAHRATDAADSILERRGRRRALDARLERAGLALRPGEFVLLTASVAAVGGLLGLVVAGPLAALAVAGGAVGVARLVLGMRDRRRRNAFAEQLGDTLGLLGGTLRAGYGLVRAVDAVASEADSPTAEEFGRVVLETRLGRDLSDSLHGMAARVGSEDIGWVVQAIDIHREVGGDLAEVLDTVAGTIRERSQLRRQVKALSAEGRFSAWVLLAMPFVVAGAMQVLNPGYLSALRSGMGPVLVAGALVMMTVGAVWLQKMCKIEF